MRRRNPKRDATLFRGSEARRLLLMVFLLVALGMALRQTSDPASWRWLAGDAAAADANTATAGANTGPAGDADAAKTAEAPEDKPSEDGERPVPLDEDPQEAEAARAQFEAISDRQPLAPEEMPAYWRLMRWAGAESFEALKTRALRGVLYTQLWEEPERYRGKPIRLRLHLRRALRHDAPANSAGVKVVYEAWGHTDESRSLPYLVVFAEPPAGFALGDPIREEGVFVGYFLKNLGYQAFDKQRGAPLLIGRLERLAPPPPAVDVASERVWFWWILGLGLAAMLATFVVWVVRLTRSAARSAAPLEAVPVAEFDTWLHHVEQAPESEPGPGERHRGG